MALQKIKPLATRVSGWDLTIYHRPSSRCCSNRRYLMCGTHAVCLCRRLHGFLIPGREHLPGKLRECNFAGTFLFAFELPGFWGMPLPFQPAALPSPATFRLAHCGLQFVARDGDHMDFLSDGLAGDASPLVERNLLRAHDIDHVMAVDRLEQKLGGNLSDVLGGDEWRFLRSLERV